MVPAGGHAVHLVGQGAGRAGAAADIGRPRAPAPRRRRPGPGGSRIPAPRGPAAARTMRLALVAMRDWWLIGKQQIGLDELRLDGGSAHGNDAAHRGRPAFPPEWRRYPP